jgi:hypothetical protein
MRTKRPKPILHVSLRISKVGKVRIKCSKLRKWILPTQHVGEKVDHFQTLAHMPPIATR